MITKLKTWLSNKEGNALLMLAATAISSVFAIYFFVAITALNQADKERITHLKNAYEMGIALQGDIANILATKLDSEKASFQAPDGTYNFSAVGLAESIPYNSGDILTLETMVRDGLILDAFDPTSSNRNDKHTNYNLTKSKIKVEYNMTIDYYNDDGDVVKKVENLIYYVNLAGEAAGTAEDNLPYNDADPFYYVVSFTDADEGLVTDNITLEKSGTYFNGVLDISTHGSGPQARDVVILPGDQNNN